MGRHSLYSDELAERILDRISNGESLARICSDEDMPSIRTVIRWAVDNQDFGTKHAQAREAQAEVMDDLILQAAAAAGDDAQASRVQIDAYKWRAAKLAPKRYSDRLDLTNAGEKFNADLDPVARATRLAAIFASIENRKGADEPE
jgi:hypothetical protein